MTTSAVRPVWDISEPAGGFAPPWPLALELADAFPAGAWSLIGGLMVQLHAVHAEVDIPRATVDVDMILHVETFMTWQRSAAVLGSLGFVLREPLARKGPAHRFLRGDDVIDVLVADHVGPWALAQRTGNRDLVRAPGGTSALRKTVDCRVHRTDGRVSCLSVPDVLGALTLKGGAFEGDSRDRGRHLEDAVVLLSTVEDADEIHEDRTRWTNRDSHRLRVLSRNLPDDHEAWRLLRDRRTRLRAQTALRVLAVPWSE